MSELQESEMGQAEVIDWRTLPSLPLSCRRKLPNCQAVYFVTSGDTLLYVGQTSSLTLRWIDHGRIAELAGYDSPTIWWMETDRKDIRKFESALIHRMKPLLNKRVENPFENTMKTKARMDRFEHKCQRCNYQWLSLMARPVVCPRCKSYSWDVKPTTKGKSKC